MFLLQIGLLYSKTLRKVIGAETPFDQYGFYVSTIGGAAYLTRKFYHAHHLAILIRMKPSDPKWMHHWSAANGPSDRQLKLFSLSRFRLYNMRLMGLIGGF